MQQGRLFTWLSFGSALPAKVAQFSVGANTQTAIVIQEYLGGEILRTTGWHGRGNHFYNHLAGERIDFTADQFEMPGYSYALKYEDRASSASEAITECLPGQVEALRRAFQNAIAGERPGG